MNEAGSKGEGRGVGAGGVGRRGDADVAFQRSTSFSRTLSAAAR